MMLQDIEAEGAAWQQGACFRRLGLDLTGLVYILQLFWILFYR